LVSISLYSLGDYYLRQHDKLAQEIHNGRALAQVLTSAGTSRDSMRQTQWSMLLVVAGDSFLQESKADATRDLPDIRVPLL
jgi:hypothetical protein